MRILIQRVSEARVEIKGQTLGEIAQGLVVFCGFAANDTEETLKQMLHKVSHYRIFSDKQGKMNLSLKDIDAGLLLIPQFTLMAQTNKGLRPSFSQGASATKGLQLFEQLSHMASKLELTVAFGQFGADMQVFLCNDGPVTFSLSFDEDDTHRVPSSHV